MARRGIWRISGLGENRKRKIVWAMASDVAQRIRRWLQQNEVGLGGRGERSCGSIGALMQSDVMMANLFENVDRNVAKPLLLCLLENFVPECTEVMLQSRKGIAYVDLGKRPQNLIAEIGAKGSASEMN